MPDGGRASFITTQTVLDDYFEGKGTLWFYRHKKRWRDAGTPFPDPLAGTHLYPRAAIDDWMAVMAANAQASGYLLGGPVRDLSPLHPQDVGHESGPAARLDARAHELAQRYAPTLNDT